VQPENEVIKLNAGPGYIMKPTDICFYMSITKEENSSVMVDPAHQNLPDEDLNLVNNNNLSRKLSAFRRPSVAVTNVNKLALDINKSLLTKCKNNY
jgi:potassium channel subfamily T protein 1